MNRMVGTAPHSLEPPSLGKSIVALRKNWPWIVGFGILSSLFGVAALFLFFSATIVSVYLIAIFIIIVGGCEVAAGFGSRSWDRFFLWIVAGLCYIALGAFALAQPLIAAAFFTLLLGTGMIVTGLIRLYLGLQFDDGIRGPVVLASIVTSLAGFLILIGWPNNSIFILGILLGLDLLVWGVGWIAFGLRLRQIHFLAGTDGEVD